MSDVCQHLFDYLTYFLQRIVTKVSDLTDTESHPVCSLWNNDQERFLKTHKQTIKQIPQCA